MTQTYCESKKVEALPRLPLEGGIDLTYKCNNKCVHCWVRTESEKEQKQPELSFGEIKNIVLQARAMGCRKWNISGGEPMLRRDFVEIFDYITRNCHKYRIATNGTLITPKIAKLMKREGRKLVSLYGATDKVHDKVSQRKGSFEETMRGFAYLREAKADFIPQLIFTKINISQFQKMTRLAESLSSNWRVGPAMLHLSSCQNKRRNIEIRAQRIKPKDVVRIDSPDVFCKDVIGASGCSCKANGSQPNPLEECANNSKEFYIDPYGAMTFCELIKDPNLRFDLRKGAFKEAWENFIPKLAEKFDGVKEYEDNCGSCDLRKNCKWCPALGYLEHGRASAKVRYFCDVAANEKKAEDALRRKNRRYYQIAGLKIRLDCALPITASTFSDAVRLFEAGQSDKADIFIKQVFELPLLQNKKLGEPIYDRAPWRVYKKNDSWIYFNISHNFGKEMINQIAVFEDSHTRGIIYNNDSTRFLKGGNRSLTLLPTDEIFLSRVLAERRGCFLHACGVFLRNEAYLFVGHSGAGKSTIARMLKEKCGILCDDRVAVIEKNGKFTAYGTWCHGDVPVVSAGGFALKAVVFIEKSGHNKIEPLGSKKEATAKLLNCMIKPIEDKKWWGQSIDTINSLVETTQSHILYFNTDKKSLQNMLDKSLFFSGKERGAHGKKEYA